MSQSHEVKPNKAAFLYFGYLRGLFISVILYFVLSFVLFFVIGAMSFLVSFFVLLIYEPLRFLIWTYRYKKEKYIFYSDRIIRKGGGIFSDYETELIISNITHVNLHIPYIENYFFKTGFVKIESAGSGISEIVLASVDKPKEMYDYVEKTMKHIGFKLTKSKLIQKERPSALGVFFEVFKGFFVTLFFIFIYATVFIADSEVALSFLMLHLIFFVPIVFLIILFLVARSFFRFLDLMKREYEIYSDTICYSEGFLSKNYAFIPIENLSDSSVTQTLIDKIFSLYDVKVSCQGSKQEILFKNMANGQKMESNLDNIIQNKKVNIKDIVEEKKTELKKETAKKSKIDFDTSFNGTYKMDMHRSLFSYYILIPLLFILSVIFVFFLSPMVFFMFFIGIGWIIGLVTTIINVNVRDYFIKNKSVEEKYNFLSKKNVEFNCEKITGVIFKESFIDKWFDTCSIEFWSIGSNESIVFRNIKKIDGLYDSILAKLGIHKTESIYKMDSKFNVIEMFKERFFIHIFAFILVAMFVFLSLFVDVSFIIPVIVIGFFYLCLMIYLPIHYSRSKLNFFKDCIYFRKGVFFESYYFSLYNNIKDIATLKYPFSKRGAITFDVAGEHIEGSGRNKTTVSNKFKINYVENIDTKDELIDLIFFKRPNAEQVAEIEKDVYKYSPKPILVAKENAANSVVTLLIASVIIFPLILLLPITVPLLLWYVSTKRYVIQSYRVYSRGGIFYKKQISVINSRIDHITFHQGMFNKMFGNASITVNTTGSSLPELILSNIDSYKEFYDLLKKNY